MKRLTSYAFLLVSLCANLATAQDDNRDWVPTAGLYGSDWHHCAQMVIPSADGDVIYTLQVGAPVGLGPAHFKCPPNIPERYVRVSTRVFKPQPGGSGQIVVLSRDAITYGDNFNRLILPMQDCAAPESGATGNGQYQPKPTFCPKGD
jgi:hypothetical protein